MIQIGGQTCIISDHQIDNIYKHQDSQRVGEGVRIGVDDSPAPPMQGSGFLYLEGVLEDHGFVSDVGLFLLLSYHALFCNTIIQHINLH